jgi:DDE domain
MIAADLRRRRPKPHTTWHLDEVYLKIDGRMAYLWRAVDAEGEGLDVLVQSKRNKQAAKRSTSDNSKMAWRDAARVRDPQPCLWRLWLNSMHSPER